MSMKTSTRQANDVTIVDCSGRIVLGEGSVILKDVVRELLSKGQTVPSAPGKSSDRGLFLGGPGARGKGQRPFPRPAM